MNRLKNELIRKFKIKKKKMLKVFSEYRPNGSFFKLET